MLDVHIIDTGKLDYANLFGHHRPATFVFDAMLLLCRAAEEMTTAICIVASNCEGKFAQIAVRHLPFLFLVRIFHMWYMML